MDIVHAACMDETHGTYVDDECFDIYAMMTPIMILMMRIKVSETYH